MGSFRNRRRSEKNVYASLIQNDVTYEAKVPEPKAIAGRRNSQQFVPTIARLIMQHKIGFGTPQKN